VDLIWRKVNTGDVVAWLMYGADIKQAGYVTRVDDMNWSVVAPH
jgi:hypothetical protein